MEIPKFLIEMSEQMNTQDNRITADPIWQVRCKRTRVTDSGYSDRFEIIDNDEGSRVACSEFGDEINEQIVSYLDCDANDLPVIFEAWVDGDSGNEEMTGEEKIEYFIESFDCHWDSIDGFSLIWVEEYEDIVKSAFLTESDANWFINRKQHDYPKLYTYVASMYLCPQMIELRAWIMSLTKESN